MKEIFTCVYSYFVVILCLFFFFQTNNMIHVVFRLYGRINVCKMNETKALVEFLISMFI